MPLRILCFWFFGGLLAGCVSCQATEARCPAGSTLVGSAPPTGTEEWCEYRDSEGKAVKHGAYIAWYESNRKQAEVNYRHGKEDGPTTLWYPDGKKMLQGNYRDGEREGVWMRWYENRIKELETEFSKGKKSGHDRKWDETGILMADVEWNDGELVRVNPVASTPTSPP